MTGSLSLWGLVIGLAIALALLFRRVVALEGAVADLRAAALRGAEAGPSRFAKPPAAETAQAPAPQPGEWPREDTTVSIGDATAPATQAFEPLTPPARPALPPRPTFEQLIGGRLPIWVGGAALVVAGIFLVRFSIEAGWLGPAIRTLLAAGFAALLLAAAEAARRFPATAADPRVGQALAGAGIASAYATLYLAAALYDLIGPFAGFLLMLAITGMALVLSLRHGPPTAVMALVGGFAAPLVAGYDAAGIAPLLGYLALFVAALWALAVSRGWGWLALAATGAGFAWSALLIALLGPADLAGAGGFALLLGITAVLALPRAGIHDPRWRLLPLLLAGVQLIALAPGLDFSSISWAFYLLLSAASLWLADRDRALLPAAFGAAGLMLALLAAAFTAGADARLPALLASALFAIPGQLRSRRSRWWAGTALLGIAGPVLVAQGLGSDLLPKGGWAAMDLLFAAAAGLLAWRHRDRADMRDTGLVFGTLAAALLGGLGLQWPAPPVLAGVPAALALLFVGAVAHRTGDERLRRYTFLPWAVAAALSAGVLLATLGTAGGAVMGSTLPYLGLPPAADTLRLLLPGLAASVALLRLDPAAFASLRRVVAPAEAVRSVMLAYLLVKFAVAIDTPARFVALGFVERAVLTHLALAAGWWLARSGRAPRLARALLVLGIVRIVWFDLLLLDPAWVSQAVGPIPLLNAVVLHLAGAAAWMWRWPGHPLRTPALLFSLLAALAAVRQLAHGSVMTGPVTTAENWGYSAAGLLVAIAWLAAGIRARMPALRGAGLLLLTLTTLKVFLVDAAALGGVLRILSFLGLGVALIAIGWAYRRFVTAADNAPPAGPAPA